MKIPMIFCMGWSINTNLRQRGEEAKSTVPNRPALSRSVILNELSSQPFRETEGDRRRLKKIDMRRSGGRFPL